MDVDPSAFAMLDAMIMTGQGWLWTWPHLHGERYLDLLGERLMPEHFGIVIAHSYAAEIPVACYA